MLIIPNLGAEQDLQRNAPTNALKPFARRAMAALFPLYAHQDEDGHSIKEFPRSHRPLNYLPTDIQEFYEPDSLFAFLNTPEILERANCEHRPLVGHPEALSFHRRDWLHQQLKTQESFQRSIEDVVAFNLSENSRESVIAEAANIIQATTSLQADRTWKPYFSASASGRCAGRGPTLSPDELNFLRDTKHTGVCLEPWRRRARDYSTQFWLTDDGPVFLSSTLQHTTPAGRYRGLTTTWYPNEQAQFQVKDLDNALHFELAGQLFQCGYRGPLGIDGFEFHTEDGIRNRSVCEINARLTMAHLLLAERINVGIPHDADLQIDALSLDLKVDFLAKTPRNL